MAFCTSCGATVQGAFCQQCGTPLSAAAAQGAAPQAAPAAVAPVKRKTSPIVWILLAVAGIFVLGILGLVAAGLYVARNPGLAIAKLITAANPDAEVLSTDLGSQTLRIRDKKTGKEVTLSFDDVKNGKFKISAMGDNGEVANVEIGGGEGKMPSWVPAYPGAKAQGNMTAKGDSGDGRGEGGVVVFTTPDSPSQVTAFYEAKCREMGMTVEMAGVSDAGGVLTAQDEGGQRTLNVMVGGGSGATSMTVTYGRKR
ncbi:MAG: zinc ribbon domain-containing protein [Candidatus Solibacter sp.]|nr:zinc ribbon domain-containing protein [Candidatus Solibacter sp.]